VFFVASNTSPGQEDVAICTQGTGIEREDAFLSRRQRMRVFGVDGDGVRSMVVVDLASCD
jgi:hypothetical protein